MLLRGNILYNSHSLNVIFKCGREELIFNLFSALKHLYNGARVCALGF